MALEKKLLIPKDLEKISHKEIKELRNEIIARKKKEMKKKERNEMFDPHFPMIDPWKLKKSDLIMYWRIKNKIPISMEELDDYRYSKEFLTIYNGKKKENSSWHFRGWLLNKMVINDDDTIRVFKI